MASGGDSQTIKILVLDDDEDDAFLICDTIKEGSSASYSITVCHKPPEAADLLRDGAVDIVLCDYLMGDITGIEFIKSMRAESIDVPIILLTGMGNENTDQAALQAGAADFISKDSVTPEVIDRSIRYAIANRERQKLLHTVLENVDAAVALIDARQEPTLWNPDFAELAEDYYLHAGGEKSLSDFAAEIVSDVSTVTVGTRVLDKKVSTLASNNSRVVILHDVTEHVTALREREAAEHRAAHLAMNCALTGLPNRNAFSERINQEIRRAEEEGTEFYLLNMDLNKFKSVNDIYGHSRGDQLLKEVARRLADCCEGNDFIARLGGDEFMAIQHKAPEDPDIPTLANRMSEKFHAPVALDDLIIHTGVSIGIAVYPHHGRSSEELMSNADIAMYRAKDDPLKRVYAFNETLDQHIRQTRQLSQDLREAIENQQLDVYFQPQADMLRGEVTGFEALARWTHPEFGPIPPTSFVAIAEENGQITDLGALVLLRSCEIAAKWKKPLKVAVNISPVQILHVDLAGLVQEVLIRTGLSPSRLELEVTESVLINDSARALHVLRGIKALGVSIALDDFGTGYSSLSTMISFPFDKIKIDRSFIESFSRNHQAAVVTRTMIGMAKQLGYRVIAEGVERREHVEFLLQEGCHEVQGFLIGKPVAEDELEFVLRDNALPTAMAISA